MTQETKYRTCQCESAQQVERQALVIRGLRKRHKVLTQANVSASHQIRRLVAENESLRKQLETMKAIDEANRKKYHQIQSNYCRAANRPDANWDSRPRGEEWG